MATSHHSSDLNRAPQRWCFRTEGQPPSRAPVASTECGVSSGQPMQRGTTGAARRWEATGGGTPQRGVT